MPDFTRGTPYGWLGTGAVLKAVPLRVSGLKAWFRADLGITLNGSNVSAWADQSGTGDANKHLTQGTAANQPLWAASDASYNGKPTLTFDGISEQMASGTWAAALTQPHTIYCVGQNANAGVYRNFVDGITTGARSIARARAGGARAGFYAGTADVDGTSTTNVPRVITYVFSGAASALYNVSTGTSETAASPGTQGFTGMRVGSDWNATGQYLDGKIAEIIIYSGAHDLATRTLIRDYLAARYGITITA